MSGLRRNSIPTDLSPVPKVQLPRTSFTRTSFTRTSFTRPSFTKRPQGRDGGQTEPNRRSSTTENVRHPKFWLATPCLNWSYSPLWQASQWLRSPVKRRSTAKLLPNRERPQNVNDTVPTIKKPDSHHLGCSSKHHPRRHIIDCPPLNR